jgi:hypothetical protein
MPIHVLHVCWSAATNSGRMLKDGPVAKFCKSRRCTASTPILIRKFSWLFIIDLRTDSQYLEAYCMGVLDLVLIFNKTETTRPYVSSIKKINVTSLQNSTHFHFSLFSACCSSFVNSFLLFSFSFYLSLHSPLYSFSVTFGLQSFQFTSKIFYFS